MTCWPDPPPAGECHLWSARGSSVTSSALQRRLLGRYLDVDPARLVVTRQCARCGHPGHGRPVVAGQARLDFSVTHSGDRVLLAVVGTGRVGVDLERRRPVDPSAVARLVCGPAELAALDDPADPSAPDRQARFLRMWVRKEAVVKLTGTGLVARLAGIDVLAGEGVVRLPHGECADPIHLVDLPAADGYVAALAATRPIESVRWFDDEWFDDEWFDDERFDDDRSGSDDPTTSHRSAGL